MSTKYPNSGSLNVNSYKNSDRQPDHKGSIKMERSVIKKLLEECEDEIEIKLSGWNMKGSKGMWIRLAWDNYKKPEAPKPQPDNEDMPF
jgi:hypothetical protein